MTLLAPLPCRFALATGTVPGREHVRVVRNNQDAVATYADDDLLVAVVADGCSAGASSEVGARFAVAWLSRWLPRLVQREAPARAWVDHVTSGLLGALSPIASSLSRERADIPMLVHEFLLFSFLAVVVEHERTVVFGAGDGIYVVDGNAVALDAGPANAPAYLSYALVDSSNGLGASPRARATIHCELRTSELHSIVVATDGAADLLREDELLADGTRRGTLAQFYEPRYAKNPSLLQKRLNVLGDRHGKLQDDTTLALLVRRELV